MAKRGRPSLSGVSIGSLQAEIQRRHRKSDKLLKVRARLARQLHALDSKIQAMGGSLNGTGGGGRRRAQNATTLVGALHKVLRTRTMGVTEVSEAVQKAGYRTNSKTFRTIVNQALLKHKDKFKKVGRGQYTAA